MNYDFKAYEFKKSLRQLIFEIKYLQTLHTWWTFYQTVTIYMTFYVIFIILKGMTQKLFSLNLTIIVVFTSLFMYINAIKSWNTKFKNLFYFIEWSDPIHTIFFRIAIRLRCQIIYSNKSNHFLISTYYDHIANNFYSENENFGVYIKKGNSTINK